MNDVASGQVDMIFAGLPAVLPMVASGQIRLLAVSTAQRSTAAPEIPTLAELGFTGFDMSNWFGLMAPTGTTAAILEKLGEARAQQRVKQTSSPVSSTGRRRPTNHGRSIPRFHRR